MQAVTDARKCILAFFDQFDGEMQLPIERHRQTATDRFINDLAHAPQQKLRDR